MDNIENSTLKAIEKDVLGIEVTTVCDQIKDCNYCFAIAGLDRLAHGDPARIRSIMKQGKDLGYRVVQLAGGEPFLMKEIFELISYAKELGYREILINTHGMKLDDGVLERLKEFRNMLYLTITVNGPRDIHELTRGKGTFDRVMEGVDRCISSNIKLSVFVTVTKQLVPVFGRFVSDLFRRYPGIHHMGLWQMHRVDRDLFDVGEFMLSPDDFIAFVKQMDVLKMLYPLDFNENPLASVVSGRLHPMNSKKGRHSMRPGRAVVMLDGSITGVHSSRRAFGKLTDEEAILKTLSSPEMNETFVNHTICPDCQYVEICRNYGMMQPAPVSFDFDETTRYCVKVNRRLDELQAQKSGMTYNNEVVTG